MSTKALPPASSTVLSRVTAIVPYLTLPEVRHIADSCHGRHVERNRMLISTLFLTGLRALSVLVSTPHKIDTKNNRFVLNIVDKGGKSRMVACPDNLAYQLKSYAFDKGLGLDDSIFNIDRRTAWMIVSQVGKRAGINKKVWPHLFRHSDAIYRLKEAGNPKALQIHLGHSTTMMTMRYLSTLSADDALRIQQEVEFQM